MKALPNILTGVRLVLSLLTFLALVMVAGAVPGLPPPSPAAANALLALAFVAFVIAAVTDFFDGWLARRYDAVSLTGAILDPIADKILVCGALLGLLVMGARDAAIPAGLILFREFAVSAMREVLAPRGVKLPVTFLAKTKTTLQLVAIGAILGLPILAQQLTAMSPLARLELLHNLLLGAVILLWIAAVVTVWTGIEYARAARKALAVGKP
jgi:CDP-diacylglycerol--glycerol-3-phosphate 3-phosphatidyltransferase